MLKDVSLREVTASTVRVVTDLRVALDQEKYVASNAVSIAQAYFHPEAWFRAIYMKDEPAGFVMLRDPTLCESAPEIQELSLWRFMVDHRFQGTGVGRSALGLVIKHSKTRPLVNTLYTSYVLGPKSPCGFYVSFGFVPTGKTKANGEVALSYKLRE